MGGDGQGACDSGEERVATSDMATRHSGEEQVATRDKAIRHSGEEQVATRL